MYVYMHICIYVDVYTYCTYCDTLACMYYLDACMITPLQSANAVVTPIHPIKLLCTHRPFIGCAPSHANARMPRTQLRAPEHERSRLRNLESSARRPWGRGSWVRAARAPGLLRLRWPRYT